MANEKHDELFTLCYIYGEFTDVWTTWINKKPGLLIAHDPYQNTGSKNNYTNHSDSLSDFIVMFVFYINIF